MSDFPNLRGTAQRDRNKSVRVGTHVPVLQMCLKDQRITNIVEHGMGLSSTAFFHSNLQIKKILSFENDKNWMTCHKCNSHQSHIIVQFDDNFKNFCENELSLETTLALIDGPHIERIKLIKFLQMRNVPYIVEHDAESLPLIELDERLNLCVINSYAAHQFISLNPESIVYTRNKLLDSNNELIRLIG